MLSFAIKVIVRFYQAALSPWIHLLAGPNAGCRFEPSCSEYCQEAISTHGLSKGGLFALRRLLRCNPFANSGFDPVPHVIGDNLKRTVSHGS